MNLSLASQSNDTRSKQELIDRIMRLNGSARLDFLQPFSEPELTDYLRRLDSLPPREEYTAWPMAC